MSTACCGDLDRGLAVVAERRAEFEEKRYIPRDFVTAFKKAGIYRASTPKQFGGDALPPAEFLRVIERISVVDGSAGWVAGFGSSLICLAALPLTTQAELYAAGPDVVFAGGLFPVQSAERVDGGYRVSGRWRFAGGCKGADVLGVGIRAGEDRAGRPFTAVLRPDQVGRPLIYLAALPLTTQAELYAAGPDVVFAGGLFPVQSAERVDGGYRVSGRWRFAGGCKGADVLGVGIRAGEDRAGRPFTAVLRPDQVEIAESWDVIGLRGTGSHDLVVNGAVVPQEWTFVRGGAPTVGEPLYRYPSVPYAAQVLAVVGLGVACAALDHVIAQGGRSGYTGAPKPAERATYRIAVGQAEAQLRSARAFFYEITEEVWSAVEGGDSATVEQASLLRLASAHLAKVSFEVVRAAYQLGGDPRHRGRRPQCSATCGTPRWCRSTPSSRRAGTTAPARS